MRRGFTLIELSIVLVIIGLLIGGILAAQTMIQTAKVQRFVRDLQQYDVSLNNFFLNFKTIPGDSPYFTPVGDDDLDLTRGPNDGGAACANGPSAGYSVFEQFHFWGHLSQAKMIDKAYQSYSPTNCGGTQPSNYEDVAISGIVFPYTELDEKASADFGGARKYPILPFKMARDENLYLEMYLSASMVNPLEVKIGVQQFDSSMLQKGLVNMNGTGACDPGNVPCTDETASYGYVYYFMEPN